MLYDKFYLLTFFRAKLGEEKIRKMQRFQQIFGKKPFSVIGMIHVKALPGVCVCVRVSVSVCLRLALSQSTFAIHIHTLL